MSNHLGQKIVVLGTGGTIAGSAASASDTLGYSAGQVGVAQLLQRTGHQPVGFDIISEQIAQIDSKDMTLSVWQKLLSRCAYWLTRSEVRAVVVTHGTDTLEETAFLMHRMLPDALTQAKPIVLTCAMRPASSSFADGPQNLADALLVATLPGSGGILVVCAGQIHAGRYVQKIHPYRLDAFDSGQAGVLGYVEANRARWLSPVPSTEGSQGGLDKFVNLDRLPWVEIVTSHADTRGLVVDAMLGLNSSDNPLQGLVVAATGNGSMHTGLEVALNRATQAGVMVVRSTRCVYGQVLPTESDRWPDSEGLSPVKARLALALKLAKIA